MIEKKLKSLTPVRIFEQVVEQICDLILTGVFSPGEKLPSEQELEQQLNVSRSSIREALRILEFEGLVEVRRGSGSFISDYPSLYNGRIEVAKWLKSRGDTLCEFLQIREYIEGLSCALAAQKANKAINDELLEIHNKLIKVIHSNEGITNNHEDNLAALDTQFHLAIGRACGNSLVNELITFVVPAFQHGNKAIIYMGSPLSLMEADHKKILMAIESGDSVEAERAKRNHIIRVRKEVLKTSYGDGSSTG
jgi:GntR family transcriptional repressor for pyruvate dehydrogenase complex